MITVSGPHPENIHRPQRKGDVGYDLAIAEQAHLWPSELQWANIGVRLGFPEGIWGEIVGRSSTMAKHRILVVHSIIDTGYTGLLTVGLINMGPKPVMLAKHTRVAQLILRETVTQRLQIGLLPETERGDAGFGSTG